MWDEEDVLSEAPDVFPAVYWRMILQILIDWRHQKPGYFGSHPVLHLKSHAPAGEGRYINSIKHPRPYVLKHVSLWKKLSFAVTSFIKIIRVYSWWCDTATNGCPPILENKGSDWIVYTIVSTHNFLYSLMYNQYLEMNKFRSININLIYEYCIHRLFKFQINVILWRTHIITRTVAMLRTYTLWNEECIFIQ